MKVQVLVSKPKSLDITLNEMMEKWHMLELIPGLECHFYTYDKSLTSEEISNIIDSDTEAVIGVYLRKDLITEDFFIKHPKLKYMAGMAHGYEEFDVELTHKYGVTITNTAYGASTIAHSGGCGGGKQPVRRDPRHAEPVQPVRRGQLYPSGGGCAREPFEPHDRRRAPAHFALPG